MSEVPPPSILDWGFACGRGYLTVRGIVVAVEGQECFDENFPRTEVEKVMKRRRHCWTTEDFKRIVNDE